MLELAKFYKNLESLEYETEGEVEKHFLPMQIIHKPEEVFHLNR